MNVFGAPEFSSVLSKVRIIHFVQSNVFTFSVQFSSVMCVRYDFVCLCRGFMFFGVLIYLYWCPPRYPYQMMFVSFKSITIMTGAISGAENTYLFRASECVSGFNRDTYFSIFTFLCSVLSTIYCLFLPIYHYSVCMSASDYPPLVSSIFS